MRSIALVMMMLAFGCSEELDRASVLNSPRVLGVVANVVDGEGRTNARPGETLTLDWILEYPGVREASTYAFFACEPAATAFGVDFCRSEADMLALEIELTPTLDPPRFEISVPDDYETSSVLVFGAICLGGDIDTAIDMTDPTSEVCRDGIGKGQIVTLSQPVDVNGRLDNQAPRISEILIDDVVWTATPPDDPSGGCDAASGYPTYAMDGDNAILVLRAGERESYEFLTGDPPELETRIEDLQTSYLATAGDLDQSFGFIDDINPESEVEWMPIEAKDEDMEVPEEGLIVKFVFVTRDLRGGVDFTTRALCLTR